MVEQRSFEEKILDIVSEYNQEIPSGFRPVLAIVRDVEGLPVDNPKMTSVPFNCPPGYVLVCDQQTHFCYCKKVG